MRLWHLDCFINQRTQLSLFPRERNLTEEEKKKAMKVLQKLIFTFAMVIGLTFVVSAQNDPKPPKGDPPVVTPKPKPPPTPKPTPGSDAAFWSREIQKAA